MLSRIFFRWGCVGVLLLAGQGCTRGHVADWKTVQFAGAALTYDAQRFAGCTPAWGARYTQQENGDGVPVDVFPAHRIFWLQDKRPLPALEKGARYFFPVASRVLVIPLGDTTVARFSEAYPQLATCARGLAHLLEIHSSLNGNRLRIPDLFEVDCAREIIARPTYLDFKFGSGIGFVTQYSQELSPINNEELAYVVQVLTRDRKYYIAACFALGHPALPRGIDTAKPYPEKWGTKYLNDVQSQLDHFPAASFLPPLKELENMLATLDVQ